MGDAGSGMNASTDTRKSDVERLHEMGYAQELNRGMSAFSNFAVSFTIISILSGCLTLFGFGMSSEGREFGLRMAPGRLLRDLRRPSHGRGVLQLSNRRWPLLLVREAGWKSGPAWSWFTGWFNLLGQVADHRGHRLRAFGVRLRVPGDRVRRRSHEDDRDHHVHGSARRARTAQHVRCAARRALQQRERLVARRRCRGDRLRACVLPDSPHAFSTIFNFSSTKGPARSPAS